METHKKEEAKQAISQLFSVMGVTRVICVDDVYALPFRYEDAVGLIEEIGMEAVRHIISNEEIPFNAGIDIWISPFRDWWNSLSREKQQILLQQLSRAKTDSNIGPNEQDIMAANILGEIFSDHEFLPISFTDWTRQRSRLIAESQTNKTLFLFDEDLTNDGGTNRGGRDLIQEVLHSDEAKEAMCGLLSHNITPQREYDIHSAFETDDYNFDLDRVIPVSKSTLYEDPLGFAKRIKITVLNPYCGKLREQASKIIKKSQKRAQEEIEAINIYNFEQIIFTASNREGIWEPDTLFRLYGLFQRLEARKKARASTKLRSLATQIRKVSDIPIKDNIKEAKAEACSVSPDNSVGASLTTESLSESSRRSWEIQRLELYESGDYINYHHLPIELGDIFEKTSGQTRKKYILLAQPCDLMVRADTGKRKTFITEGILARIVDKLPEDKRLEMYYELLYFDSNDGTSKYVKFLETCMVKLFVLDLCVFNREGEAHFKVNSECPKTMIVAWNKYHRKIKEQVKGYVGNYIKLQKMRDKYNEDKEGDNQIPESFLKTIIPEFSSPELFKVAIDRKAISFDCKRVERLCPSHAAALLTKYYNFSARAAFELDFGK